MPTSPLPPQRPWTHAAAPPLAPAAIPDRFPAKTCIHWVLALLAAALGLTWLGLGLAFLTGTMEPADGRPGTGVGILLSVLGLAAAGAAAIGLLYLRARQAPVIRLYREGIEFNRFNEHGLEAVPVMAVPIAWFGALIGGFNLRTTRIHWEHLRGVRVGGVALVRSLDVLGVPDPAPVPPPPLEVSVRDADVDAPVDRIAGVIDFLARTPAARAGLASWAAAG